MSTKNHHADLIVLRELIGSIDDEITGILRVHFQLVRHRARLLKGLGLGPVLVGPPDCRYRLPLPQAEQLVTCWVEIDRWITERTIGLEPAADLESATATLCLRLATELAAANYPLVLDLIATRTAWARSIGWIKYWLSRRIVDKAKENGRWVRYAATLTAMGVATPKATPLWPFFSTILRISKKAQQEATRSPLFYQEPSGAA